MHHCHGLACGAVPSCRACRVELRARGRVGPRSCPDGRLLLVVRARPPTRDADSLAAAPTTTSPRLGVRSLGGLPACRRPAAPRLIEASSRAQRSRALTRSVSPGPGLSLTVQTTNRGVVKGGGGLSARTEQERREALKPALAPEPTDLASPAQVRRRTVGCTDRAVELTLECCTSVRVVLRKAESLSDGVLHTVRAAYATT